MTRIILACLLAFAMILHAQARSGRPSQAKLVRDLYCDATVPAATRRLQAEFMPQVAALNKEAFEPGCLRLLDGRRLSVLGLRYHASQHLVETQDSVQPSSTRFWPLSRLRGFDIGSSDLAAAPDTAPRGPVAPAGPRRFRTRLVREGRWSSHRETVEILTCVDAGPLVLALRSATTAVPAQLLAGSGTDHTEPLRPLELTRDAVLRLCGAHAYQVRAYAMTYDLHFEQPTDVARMFDYFNHLAVVKN